MKLFEAVMGKKIIVQLDTQACMARNHLLQGIVKEKEYSEDGEIFWVLDSQMQQFDDKGNLIGSSPGKVRIKEKLITQIAVIDDHSGIVIAGPIG